MNLYCPIGIRFSDKNCTCDSFFQGWAWKRQKMLRQEQTYFACLCLFAGKASKRNRGSRQTLPSPATILKLQGNPCLCRQQESWSSRQQKAKAKIGKGKGKLQQRKKALRVWSSKQHPLLQSMLL